MIRKILLGLTIVAFACAGGVIAQQGGIKRTPLQKVEFPEGYVVVSGIAEVPVGGTAGRHTHPGDTCWKAKPTSLSRETRPASNGRGFLFDPGRCRA